MGDSSSSHHTEDKTEDDKAGGGAWAGEQPTAGNLTPQRPGGFSFATPAPWQDQVPVSVAGRWESASTFSSAKWIFSPFHKPDSTLQQPHAGAFDSPITDEGTETQRDGCCTPQLLR